MESIKMLLVLMLLCAHVDCQQETSPDVKKDSWNRGGGEKWQDDLPEDNPIDQFARMVKRARYEKFYSLMGKRSPDPKQTEFVGRKRQKGEMFIGLMGRRSDADPLPELELSPYYSRRRK
ncbi:protachykinin-1 isoform X2 [Callorhinchus milii]|uniref:Protachykinin-like n=1 Tax=Callorhinchus milii TaxID=7868 RepID=V9LET1_CALMI|nr:protachykinin-1 isoform X2 [Callorhinchus milii]|eukprot:gi/632967025/ref/XP_007899743.1/ PREDICTED: protachykinin-like isoform X2 [Callorhinchus milii]